MERKTFSVVFAKERVKIREKSSSVEVTAGIEESLARRLLLKIKKLEDGLLQPGFIGSRRGKEMDVILNLKRNAKGFFPVTSLLCFKGYEAT